MAKIEHIFRLLQDKLFLDKLPLVIVSCFHITQSLSSQKCCLIFDTKVIMGLAVSPVRPEDVLINSL